MPELPRNTHVADLSKVRVPKGAGMRLMHLKEIEDFRWLLYQFHKHVYVIGDQDSLRYLLVFPL